MKIRRSKKQQRQLESEQMEIDIMNDKQEMIPYVNVENIKKVFDQLMSIIEKKKKTINFDDVKEHYNIRNYNIEKLSLEDIRTFHKQIVQKYRTKKLKRTWCQNQLRLFVWILFNYENSIKKSIQEFVQKDWNQISSIFVNKNIEDCKFQWLSLMKDSKNIQNWTPEEDSLLYAIINEHKSSNKWNEIAKQLYRQSNSKYFRKPKQCRQRWRNYLDPNIQKGHWTDNEDHRLLQLSLELGKKWSNISKMIKNRTQHSVKNRYNSLIRKYLKKNPKKPRKKLHDAEIQAVKMMIKQLNKLQETEKIQNQQDKQINLQQQAPIQLKKVKSGFRQYKQPKKETQINQQQQKNWICSPLTPFSYADKTKQFGAQFGTLMFITSPRTKSPRFRNFLDWGNKQDDYFM